MSIVPIRNLGVQSESKKYLIKNGVIKVTPDSGNYREDDGFVVMSRSSSANGIRWNSVDVSKYKYAYFEGQIVYSGAGMRMNCGGVVAQTQAYNIRTTLRADISNVYGNTSLYGEIFDTSTGSARVYNVYLANE